MSEGELDILISRVIDGCAGDEDWKRLEALGALDPGIWRELAHAQRHDALLRQEVERATRIASHIEVRGGEIRQLTIRRSARVAMWGGWAAAAMLALAFVSGVPVRRADQGAQQASLSAADALARYLDAGQREGRVIREEPTKVLVETRPAENGRGYEVVFYRLIMERQQVPDLYRLTSDELGRAVPVRVEPPAPTRPGPV
jgi:hypothetical protein